MWLRRWRRLSTNQKIGGSIFSSLHVEVSLGRDTEPQIAPKGCVNVKRSSPV